MEMRRELTDMPWQTQSDEPGVVLKMGCNY